MNKLICKYDERTTGKLLELAASKPFDILTIENVQAATKDVSATEKVLTTAQQLGISPYDILNVFNQDCISK